MPVIGVSDPCSDTKVSAKRALVYAQEALDNPGKVIEVIDIPNSPTSSIWLARKVQEILMLLVDHREVAIDGNKVTFTPIDSW